MSRSGSLALARVMAHCGGSTGEAVAHAASAIGDDPTDPEAYELLADLRRTAAGEVAAAVAAPGDLWQFVATSYLRFRDGEMDQAAGFLGSVIGYRPHVAWASAPWFSDERFVGALTAAGLADAPNSTLPDAEWTVLSELAAGSSAVRVVTPTVMCGGVVAVSMLRYRPVEAGAAVVFSAIC
jgi:hypothetical protein